MGGVLNPRARGTDYRNVIKSQGRFVHTGSAKRSTSLQFQQFYNSRKQPTGSKREDVQHFLPARHTAYRAPGKRQLYDKNLPQTGKVTVAPASSSSDKDVASTLSHTALVDGGGGFTPKNSTEPLKPHSVRHRANINQAQDLSFPHTNS
ncbi:hypothetical protein J6590_089155 [Homalodisca vitripennis]|nr:hypothetical protein J6590_089739 [Homalodisca vitripennis]KAG8275301.1 hypothetical protein J6590_089155 [Homalodisca vitripennis]